MNSPRRGGRIGSVVPCEKDQSFRTATETYAEELKVEAHKIGSHGLSEKDFYASGLFRAAIERIRGQQAAEMGTKRDFVKRVLNSMEDQEFIESWEPAPDAQRIDYVVTLKSRRHAAIALTGCMDGQNTTIFERPPGIDEFVVWSVCANPSADPRHNVWSGIHTRLGAEIIAKEKRVDGLVVWDWRCGSGGDLTTRNCPKVAVGEPVTTIGPFKLPPPCIYLFPSKVPTLENPAPEPHTLESVELLGAFHRAFKGTKRFLHSVRWKVTKDRGSTIRTTTIERNGDAVHESSPAAIRRT